MRKALIPALLLVVTAIVLGSTVFREQVVNAATTPFQNVVVTNTSTNPVPVKQVGTSTTTVTGKVGIDTSANTVRSTPTEIRSTSTRPTAGIWRASRATSAASSSTAAGTSRRPRRQRRPAR